MGVPGPFVPIHPWLSPPFDSSDRTDDEAGLGKQHGPQIEIPGSTVRTETIEGRGVFPRRGRDAQSMIPLRISMSFRVGGGVFRDGFAIPTTKFAFHVLDGKDRWIACGSFCTTIIPSILRLPLPWFFVVIWTPQGRESTHFLLHHRSLPLLRIVLSFPLHMASCLGTSASAPPPGCMPRLVLVYLSLLLPVGKDTSSDTSASPCFVVWWSVRRSWVQRGGFTDPCCIGAGRRG